jgi:uncharacterized membrane protein YeaQ/YmgE (transglycosylase-associated protein family)
VRAVLRALGLGLLTICVSSLIGSAMLVFIIAGPGPDWDWAGLGRYARRSAGAGAAALPFVAVGLVAFGLPVDWLLRRIEQRGRLAYGAFGLVGGLFGGTLLGLFTQYPTPLAWIGALYGLVTALIFRLVFARYRPAPDEA